MIVDKETLDVFVEEISEEEVDSEFPICYTVAGENNSAPNDTSRLINSNPDVFRHFVFRHLR